MERTTRKLGVYRLGLLSTLSVVALLAGPMARAYGEMPPEDCFAFCGGACACDPQGACGGQNCPGACACGAAGCMGGGCQNCVVQNCGCTFWGCPCGQHCSNGMPPCGGGPVVCEFGGCMATGCVNNVCPDICANADPGIPCDDCDCGNTNPPPVGCACGAAVCSNAVACINNCVGACGGFDCECVGTCQMPQCGGMQEACPCGGDNCDPFLCQDICVQADDTDCGSHYAGGAWNDDGTVDCANEAPGCQGYGCMCGKYCLNVGRPCGGTVSCTHATDGCVNSTAGRGSPAPCTANRHRNCGGVGYDCVDKPVCKDSTQYPCPTNDNGDDHGGWCCAGCTKTAPYHVASGCRGSVFPGGLGGGGYCERETPAKPGYLHCGSGNCSCSEVDDTSLCNCNDDCQSCPRQGGQRQDCSKHCGHWDDPGEGCATGNYCRGNGGGTLPPPP